MESLGVRPVTVIEIRNPFKPNERAHHALVPRPGESLDILLQRIGIDPEQSTLVHGGQKIEPGEAQYHLVMPGDSIVCAATPGGGVLKTVGMIAILAATAALTGGLGDIAEAAAWGALGISTAATATVVAAGIAIGGSLLMSAFAGPSLASPGAASVTYDPTGPKSLAQPGTPVPKGYGTMGWAGNIVSSFVDQDGKDQYLNILVCFGFGKAKSVTDIFVNSRPITSFRDLSYQVRLGTNDQTPIQGFSRIQNTFPQEIRLLAEQPPVIVTGTGSDTSGLQIAVKFPGGLMRTDDHGDPKECSFAYKVEVSPGGQNQWTAPIFPRTTKDVKTTDANGYQHYPYWVVLPTDRYAGSGIVYSTDTNQGAHHEGEPWSMTQSVKVYNIDNTNYTYSQTFTGEWHHMSTSENLESVTDWWAGWRIVSAMTDQSFYDVVNVYGLTAGKWDCRVTKYGAGPHNESTPFGDGYLTNPHYTADGWLWTVNEIQFADLAYPNMILLGIRALATDQLSGANITVLATVEHDLGEDTVVPPQLASYETDNPALVLYDIIANPLYGMNVAAQADIPSLVRLANYCDEPAPNSQGGMDRRFVFGGVFDQTGNAWGALQQVAQMCLSQIVQKGNSYAVVTDAPTDISQIFTDGNIAKGSFSESFVGLDDRCNQIECTFADATRNWRTDLPVSVITSSDIISGQQPKITRTQLLGCTSRDQAWRWAYFHLLSTDTLLRTVKFSASLEAVACEVGSVIGLQVGQWGYGGRVQAASTIAALLTDRDDLPAYTPNAGWNVGVIHPVLLRGGGKVTGVSLNPAANTVTFDGLPAGRILKIVLPSGKELPVRGTGGTVCIVDSAAGVTLGMQCTFYDQDVSEVRVVQSISGETIVPALPFSQTPSPDAPWVLGQTAGGTPAKLFRVTSLRQSSDFAIEISGIEYNPAIYVAKVPQFGEQVSFPTIQSAVANVALKEQYQRTVANTKSTQSQISVTWDNGPNTTGALIYGSVDGSDERLLGKAVGTGFTFSATQGDAWNVRVVGTDALGRAASHTDAPVGALTVAASTAAPADITNLIGDQNPNVLGLYWDTVQGVTYEVRYNADPSNPDWSKGTVLVTNVQPTALRQTGYNVANPGGGLYMVKAVAGSLYSVNPATYYLTLSSSSLNGVATIAPGQQLLVSASGSGTSWSLNMPSQSLFRGDGTTLIVAAGTLPLPTLAANTTYYIYTFLRISDGTIHSAKGDGVVPDTAPSPATAMSASFDGRFTGPLLTVTTGAAGTGGSYTGGGTGTCPDGREIVTTLERGDIPCADVEVGDFVLGWCFEKNKQVYREVKRKEVAEAWAWYLVDGYRMSPLDPVWQRNAWVMPYKVGVADYGAGLRVRLTVEADVYDQANYYLTGRGSDLLIHNYQVRAC